MVRKKGSAQRIKRSCYRKIAVRENFSNLEKLMRRKFVTMIHCMVTLSFIEKCVQPLEILDEMENSGIGG